VGPKLNGTHQLLAYADDMIIQGNSIETINKNTKTSYDTNTEVGLEVNVETIKYTLLSPQQNAGQNRDIIIVNRSFESVSQFRYLVMTVMSQNLIQEEIERRLNSGIACCHSVQKVLSSCLPSRNVKIGT
jgi:hypothetical protein